MAQYAEVNSRKERESMKKAVLAAMMILCAAMACSAEPAKQAEVATAAQAQQQTLEQLNAQYIYLSGAKEVMTAQAKFANELVGSYTVQLEQIKAKIEAMQPKPPAEAKTDAKKK